MDRQKAFDIYRRLRSMDSSLDNAADVKDAILFLCEMFFQEDKGISSEGERGAPAWLGYEHRIWELGETLFRYLKIKKVWQGKGSVLDALATVVEDCRYDKGREMPLLVLGQYGKGAYEHEISSCLSDPNINGHAVEALRKAKIPGYTLQVRHIAETTKHGWIRQAARKYCEKFPPSS